MVSISSESVDVPINNVDATRRKVHTTTPPPNDSTVELSLALPKNNKVKLRKQTQDIAARAAQRRANLHHKELMEDMGSVFSSEPVVSKENTASAFGLEITSVKPKKTVTINDQPNGLRRTNSDSPELTKHQTTTNGKKKISPCILFEILNNYILESYNSTPYNRTSKITNKKRSICNKFLFNYNKIFVYILFLAHGSTLNNRTSIPVANIVVPREHY